MKTKKNESNPQWEAFKGLATKLISVPKAEMDKALRQEKTEKKEKA